MDGGRRRPLADWMAHRNCDADSRAEAVDLAVGSKSAGFAASCASVGVGPRGSSRQPCGGPEGPSTVAQRLRRPTLATRVDEGRDFRGAKRTLAALDIQMTRSHHNPRGETPATHISGTAPEALALVIVWPLGFQPHR